jgi:putative flippase GtrA
MAVDNPQSRVTWAQFRITGFRFAQISGLSFAVNIGVTVFLHEHCGATEELAFATALVVVFLMNLFTMRYYIYNGRSGCSATQFTVYLGSAIVFRGSEYIVFLVLHTWLQFDYRLVAVAVTPFSAVLKFFYYRLVFERLATYGKREA